MHDKILLIEDDASIIRFLSLSLDKNGYKVIEARNGIEGISLFMSDNPDLILLDLGLPDMDGVDVIRKIRQRGAASDSFPKRGADSGSICQRAGKGKGGGTGSGGG